MYGITSRAAGLKIRTVPLKDFRYDLEGIIAAITSETKMIFIANPDNPTGTYTTTHEIEKFIDSVPEDIIIFLDEAYYEYAIRFRDYPDSMKYQDKGNIITARTFSKIYGLAGLRIGYAISQFQIIELMNKVRGAFNVNSLAQTAAVAALEDMEHLKKVAEMTEEGKIQLYQGLTQLGVEYIPSATNFILVKLGTKAESTSKRMIRRGVITRHMGAWGLPEHIRVTVGTVRENERFLEVLRKPD